MQHEMAGLDEKIFKTNKIAGELIVILCIVVGSKMAVYSLFSGTKGLGGVG
jgi:hypothetical protein